ncbi:MAG: uncharacterized protein A8A55_0319 [Amphiamblys sp. WSBS2006]|nr:MAG: uncharacterized protein A8A55_0319 [Amphiamblys sp. WSBS2006]
MHILVLLAAFHCSHAINITQTIFLPVYKTNYTRTVTATRTETSSIRYTQSITELEYRTRVIERTETIHVSKKKVEYVSEGSVSTVTITETLDSTDTRTVTSVVTHESHKIYTHILRTKKAGTFYTTVTSRTTST